MAERRLRTIVLVGGEGTRLRPLTLTRPKPLLPVLGVSILERKIAHLAAHGVTDAVLSLGYKPDAFLDAFPSGSVCGVRLHYAVEPTPLDTAGAVRFAAEAAGFDGDDGPLIVVNGDLITELDISEQVAFHRRVGAEATLALTRVDDPSAFGVVPTDEHGRVIAFVEKPSRDEAPTDWINAGVYVIEPSVLSRIEPDRKVSIERVVFPAIAAEGALFAVHSPAYWIDAGTPWTYLQANLDALAASGVDAPGGSVIGDDARVAATARVERSVVLSGARIDDDAIVTDSIIGADAHVGRGASISEWSIVGDGAVVAPGAQLRDARVS